MSQSKTLTTASGAPVADNQNSRSAGPGGPLLLDDFHLIEKLARFDRERITSNIWSSYPILRFAEAPAVTAIVVVKTGHELSEGQVLAFCRQHMAPFKIPKKVVFVDSLPKNPSGKLLKRELRTRFADLLKDAEAS